ncbi:hypothetical protein J3T99_05460 [Acetobacteraceae bacterium B3987]|nr:hypothetical protein [Acetobacteraceae bacterium B3987]
MRDEVKKHDITMARRNLLDQCGNGADALNKADKNIAAHALRMIRASLDVLADCDGVGPEAHDTILHANDLLSDAQFEIEARGTIPPVRSINNGLSEAASCLLGLSIRQQLENVRSIEIGTGPSALTAGRVSK